MKPICFIFFLLISISGFAQKDSASGIIVGNIVEKNGAKSVAQASIILINQQDTLRYYSSLADEAGEFEFKSIPYGIYRLKISAIGFANLSMDSIWVRKERNDFNLSDIKLARTGDALSEVVVYAEKPLYENKDGKITFNASESAMSNSSSASELLQQTPLVSVDEDGKLLMKGKEVKILIDDKPVEMDAKQLQELLESMPGSMIEKIEVLTTPPPQYANERGGVINIVTKKGKVGWSGRINIYGGSRGETGANGNISYRKNKLNLNATLGFSQNEYRSNSYSNRQNFYKDSSNYFKTIGNNKTNSNRPNARIALDYAIGKQSNLNTTLLYNSTSNSSTSNTNYKNLNRFEDVYKISNRTVQSEVENRNPSVAMTYTYKPKKSLEILTIAASYADGQSRNNRNYYQQYLNVDNSFTGQDSTQQQKTRINNKTLSFRFGYDRPLANRKFYLSTGGQFNRYTTYNNLHSLYLQKSDSTLVNNPVLSNEFEFYQTVYSLRAAIRYEVRPQFLITVGLQQEYSRTSFDIVNNSNNYANPYFSSLPFFTLTKKWDNNYNLTVSYKRSIKRPGINNLNPSVDYADPYNTRFGNPYLQPYYSDNFDLGAGYWKKTYNINVAFGYNALQNIFNSIRTLQSDGKTFTTWQNLSGRKEYEMSIWGGFNISSKIKTNISGGYNYNVYSEHDRTNNRYQNGGSLNSSITTNYTATKLLSLSGNFAYRRFANPQGSVRSTVSMRLGAQYKFFNKNLTVSLNVIDPFREQQNKYFTYAPNYTLESFNMSNSRNFKLALAYNIKKATKKAVKKPAPKKLVK